MRELADLPGPKGLPFFGNAFQIQPRQAMQTLEAWAREFRPLGVARFPRGTLLMVTDPEATELILRARPGTFRRWSPLELIFEELGAKGVFSVEGEAWRVQRRLVNLALSQKHIKPFFPTLLRVAHRLVRYWRSASAEGRVIDPASDLMRFTADVTVCLAFGTDINSFEGGEGVLQKNLSMVFPAMGRRLNKMIPYWRYFKLPSDRALDRGIAELRVLQKDLLLRARAELEARASAEPGEQEPRNMLEAMLLAKDEGGQPFSDEAIYGNMLTMLLAGEDTTAFALAWALHYLADRPEMLARMKAEAQERLRGRSFPETLEDLAPLPYIDAVAQEALRLKSPAPLLPLEALEETSILDVRVPRGTAVQVMTRLPTLDEERFVRPSEFLPERWLGELGPDAAHDGKSSLAFGSGPRICPGRSLALLEMRLVLLLLAAEFQLERVGRAEDVHELTRFVMAPEGIRLRLRGAPATPSPNSNP